MIVMKFGGTSLGNAERIRNAANIVRSYADKKPVVVVSAVTKITDKLIQLDNSDDKDKILDDITRIHYKILEDLELDESLLKKDIEELKKSASEKTQVSEEKLDKIQSFGEQMSSKILAAQLSKIGINAEAFNAWDLGFVTDSNFGNAEPLEKAYGNLKNNIDNIKSVAVVTGFLGKTEQGKITTLGRGGSDYTAAVIGNAIDAEEIQIWTDVEGIMSIDPKIVEDAKTLDKISFAEASELAYFGARVLHPKTILPAMRKSIPVRVLNSLNPGNKGTVILKKAEKNSHIVKAIAYKKNITLINIQSTRMFGAHGFLAKLFGIFEKFKKSVDVISTSEVSVSLTIDNEQNLTDIIKALEKIAMVKVLRDKAIICVVGEGMRHAPGIAGRTFSALGKNRINIEMISQGASEINITFTIDGKDAEKAVEVLHKEYYPG
jgi:aspartate kinase